VPCQGAMPNRGGRLGPVAAKQSLSNKTYSVTIEGEVGRIDVPLAQAVQGE
jgi:hypothetical protein